MNALASKASKPKGFESSNLSLSARILGISLKVEQRTLNPLVLVRVQDAQPEFKKYIGTSPSGKASVFGTDIRRFESSRPSHFLNYCKNTEPWQSGLMHSLGKRAGRKVSGVRISPVPPEINIGDQPNEQYANQYQRTYYCRYMHFRLRASRSSLV